MTEQSIFRLADLVGLIGLRKSVIYKMMREGDFPPPVKLTRKAVGWHRKDIDTWLASRPRVGDKAA